MRNTTKLKTLLMKYVVSLEMNDAELWVLLLCDKDTNSMQEFEGKSYSAVISKAYSYLLKSLKNPIE
ncbi:MAG: hypothetical protein NTX03_04830 [Bacteroidetes bacterium]|nr:hypothetical protein [Bacteroidota bacterium]